MATRKHLDALSGRTAAPEAEDVGIWEESKRHQGLFAAMSDGLCLVEVVPDASGAPADLRYLEVNDAYAGMVGRSHAEIVGRTAREVLPGVSAWWIETLGRVALSRVPARFERYGEVTRRHYEVQAWSPRPGQCAALFRDVTAQRDAEEALRASQRRMARNLEAMTRLQALSTRLMPTDDLMALLREILAAAADLTGNDKGNIQFVDASTGKLRIVAQQGLSKPYCEYFAEDGCEGTCKAALASRKRVVVADLREESILQGTEDLAVCEAEGLRAVISTPLVARDGRMLGMLSNHYTAPHHPDEHELHVIDLLARMAADVVERARGEDALRESEARFRDTLDNSRDVVYRRNLRTRRYDYVSPAAERVHGYTADEILAMAVDEVIAHVHPDDVAGFLERDAALAESQEERPSNTSVYRWRSKSGAYVWLSASRTLIRDAKGRPLAHVGMVRNVTDIKHAQEEREELLRRVEAERATLEAVLEQMPSGVVIAEAPSGRITVANRRMQEIAGWAALPGSAFEERHHWKGYHPDGRPYRPEEWPLARSLRHGEIVHDEEIAVVRGDGTRGVISASGTPVRDAEGGIIAGVVINLDITRRKEAETALENMARFPDENPEPILRVAHDGTLLFANAASAPILAVWGCRAQGRVPETWRRLVAAALGDGRWRALDLADGATIYALRVVPIAGADYANIYGANVTAQRGVMAALRESEEHFRELADAMPQLVWTARPDGMVDYYNRRHREFAGIAPQGDTWEWAPTLHPDDVEPTVQAWQRAVETGTEYRIEHRALMSDGSYRWFLSRGVPTRDAEGRVIRWHGTATDIHETKLAQEALREREEQLQELSETLEQRVADRTTQLRALAAQLTVAEERERRRLADVLHDDLQQTLAAAMFHLDLAREQLPGEKAGALLREPMAMLREAIDTARSLSAELSPNLLRDAGLTEALWALAHRMEQQHGLRVAVEADEPHGAPSLPGDLKLLLYRSVGELLFNAVKHAGVGAATLRVDWPEPHTVRLMVVDDGRGFDPTEVGRRERRDRGLGLLSIVERLTYVGGSVQVDSAPGCGTRVTLIVPLDVTAAADESGAGAPHGASVGGTSPWLAPPDRSGADGRIRVLLADDHAILRGALASLLGQHPDIVVVGEAEDGLQAVDLARALHPDVVLMDIAMPNMNGIDATHRIAAELPGTRIIALSMFDGPEKQDLMREAGAHAYIPKGGPPHVLLAAIRAGFAHKPRGQA